MSCPIYRILTFNTAMHSLPVQIINENGEDKTKDCQYSWSFDTTCWTSWSSYDQYLQSTSDMDSDFFLRILIPCGLKEVKVDGNLTRCYSLQLQQRSINFDVCSDPNLFQPYQGLDCALQLQQQLADAVICSLGIPVYYFRVSPDQSTADYTFKEFRMHDIVDCKQIKLMIEDGQMPSSNPRLNDFDFDWDVDWMTEISKTQFARAFGDQVIPKQRDIIYIPLMKRMWEVTSAYEEKNEGLMWRSTTWHLALAKYSNSTNNNDSDFDDIIDNLVGKTYKETFGDKETLEQERLTGQKQITEPRFTALNLHDIFMEDAVRSQYTKDDIQILDKFYCHHNNIISRNLYKFRNENGCIVYQKHICGDEGMISFIIDTPGRFKDTFGKEIAEFGPIVFEMAYLKDEDMFRIGVGTQLLELTPFCTYQIIYRWSRRLNVCELSAYIHTHRNDIPIYMLRPEGFWFDYENGEIVSTTFNHDYDIRDKQTCQVHAWPLAITNIRLYNQYTSEEEAIKECNKYTTDSANCVFNDVARPINTTPYGGRPIV